MTSVFLKSLDRFYRSIIAMMILSIACLHVQSQVVVYTDCNYRGAQSRLSPGTYNNAYQINLPDRSISSLQIPRGYLVELFSGPNLTGSTGTYAGNVSCLSSSWNNQIRSLRVILDNGGWPGGGGGNQMNSAGVFTDCDYRGRSGYLPPGDYPSLRNIIGNLALASLRIPQGMYIELYTEENFRGTSTGKILQDQRCFGNFWYKRASSARVRYVNDGWAPPPPVYPPVPNNAQITVYSFCNYLGLPMRFGQGEIVSLRDAMGGRPLGSMMIPMGMTVELYSQPYMRGTMIGRFTSNLSCIQGFATFAESMRIYPSGPFGGTSNLSNVWIYSGCQFTGKQLQLNVGRYANLQSGALLSPSSLRVPRGYEVILYTDYNFRGTTTKITADNLCLGNWIRGMARSMIIQRVYNPYGPRSAATEENDEVENE